MSALILFDFDGTLADTAPRPGRRRQPATHSQGPGAHALRSAAADGFQGARGLLRAALGLLPDHPDYEPTRLQFLEDYAAESTVHSRLFRASPTCSRISPSAACPGASSPTRSPT